MQKVIDIQQEQLIPLRGVPELLPKRNGKRLHCSTVFRWANKGTGGCKLETVLIGGMRYTSEEALQRFARAKSMVDLETGILIAEILDSEGV